MRVDGHDGSSGCPIACFINVILEPQLDLHKLELPRKFLTNYGDDLANVIHLTIPTGKVWKFKLVRENCKAFLQNGWPEFSEFYSLSEDHFLVFKYHGNSCFDVIICDSSFSEIDYPLGHETCKQGQPPLKRKTIALTKSTTSKKAKGMQNQLIVARSLRYGGLTIDETERVRGYASCQCKHPSFASKMQPSYIEYKFKVGIPREFVKRQCNYLFDGEWALDLRTGTEKPWLVKTSCSCTGVKLSWGWKKFVSDNKLRVGDVCIFELINKQEIKVHILGAANDDENREIPEIKIEVE